MVPFRFWKNHQNRVSGRLGSVLGGLGGVLGRLGGVLDRLGPTRIRVRPSWPDCDAQGGGRRGPTARFWRKTGRVEYKPPRPGTDFSYRDRRPRNIFFPAGTNSRQEMFLPRNIFCREIFLAGNRDFKNKDLKKSRVCETLDPRTSSRNF